MHANIDNLLYASQNKTLYLLLGVSDYYDCIGRGPSPFCEMSAEATKWVTDPFR